MTKPTMKRKLRKWKMWAGFTDDEFYIELIEDGFGAHFAPAVFRSRADARLQYTDVRRIEIRELPRKKR